MSKKFSSFLPVEFILGISILNAAPCFAQPSMVTSTQAVAAIQKFFTLSTGYQDLQTIQIINGSGKRRFFTSLMENNFLTPYPDWNLITDDQGNALDRTNPAYYKDVSEVCYVDIEDFAGSYSVDITYAADPNLNVPNGLGRGDSSMPKNQKISVNTMSLDSATSIEEIRGDGNILELAAHTHNSYDSTEDLQVLQITKTDSKHFKIAIKNKNLSWSPSCEGVYRSQP